MKEVLGIKLFNYDEVAAMLGVHPSTILRYVKEQRLSAKMIGRTKYISEPELKKFILGEEAKAEE